MNNNDFAFDVGIQFLSLHLVFYVGLKYVAILRASNKWIKIICIGVHQSS